MAGDAGGDGGLVAQGPRGIAHDRPTLIPARDAVGFLWGDEQAGYVSDWIYGSSPITTRLQAGGTGQVDFITIYMATSRCSPRPPCSSRSTGAARRASSASSRSSSTSRS